MPLCLGRRGSGARHGGMAPFQGAGVLGQGYVYLPNVNLVQEMVSLLNANRGYEANAAAVKTVKDMALKTLDLIR